MEAELLVVVRPGPLDRVDGAALECRIDVCRGDHLHGDAQARHDLTTESGNSHTQAGQVRDAGDRLPEPATHLGARGRYGEGDQAEVCVDRVEKIEAATVIHPGELLVAAHPEGNRRVESQRGVLARVEVAGRDPALDRALHHPVHDLEGWNDLAGAEHADVEVATRHLGDALRHAYARPIQDVGARREAARQAPIHAGASDRAGTSRSRIRTVSGAGTEGDGARAGSRFFQKVASLDRHPASASVFIGRTVSLASAMK